MRASDWVAVVIAGLGILGTLGATALAQRGEAKRAARARQIEETRRAADRRDALEREQREAIRSDYREILRFVSRTRVFVLELRSRLVGFEDWAAHGGSLERDMEDLEGRAEALRRSLVDELPDVQSLVGAWAPDSLVTIFDELADFGPKIRAGISTALHFEYRGKRLPNATDDVVGVVDNLVALLNQARDALRAEQQPK